MSKFAIDDKYLETLERKRAEREKQMRERLLNLDIYYLHGDGEVPYDVISPTANARPTLTTSQNPIPPHQTSP